LDSDLTADDDIFLLRHDTDGFNRWDAAQRLYTNIILDTHAINQNAFLTALKDIINTLKNDNLALLVRLLTLPGDTTLANKQKASDPDVIIKGKERLQAFIATELSEEFDSLYAFCAPDTAFKTDPESMAKRAMRNLILQYKFSVSEGSTVRMAYEQYQNALTMTEKLGALSVLVNSDRPERDHAIESFYQTYRQHDLVIDKWFSVQACSTRHDTPARVKTLMSHPDFKMTNPNRVRSLIGAFAMRNMKGFHTISGEGYRLLSNMIIELDGKNPQIAARLMTPFKQWKSFKSDRQKLMKAELKRIVEKDNLSPAVYEIATKCLDG
jgi:aminopeptidase N